MEKAKSAIGQDGTQIGQITELTENGTSPLNNEMHTDADTNFFKARNNKRSNTANA